MPALAAVMALSLTAGCSAGEDVAEVGSAEVGESPSAAAADGPIEVPVITDDGRMLQPEGHVGLWFETEPEDPLDHLVWTSQRFVGKPIQLKALGDDAWSPEGAHLPDVCAPEVIGRMVELGFEVGVDRDIGPEFVQCTVYDPGSDRNLGGIGFLWGASASVDAIAQNGEVSGPDQWGYESMTEGGLAEYFDCVSLRRSFSDVGAVIAHFDGMDRYESCAESQKTLQLVHNVLGGDLVQI